MDRWAEITAEGARRVVTLQREFRTDPDDLWNAITEPERAGRWLASLSIDGDAVTLGFAGGSKRSGRILECEPPRRLRVVLDPDTPEQSSLVATLEPTAAGTLLHMQQDGLPPVRSALFTAGWQLHGERLDALTGGSDEPSVMTELLAAYRENEAAAVAGWITDTDDGFQFELERVIAASPAVVRDAILAPEFIGQLPAPFDVDESDGEITIRWPDGAGEVVFALSAHPAGTLLRVRQPPTSGTYAGRRIPPVDAATGWHAMVDGLQAGLAGIPLPEGDALWTAARAVYAARV